MISEHLSRFGSGDLSQHEETAQVSGDLMPSCCVGVPSAAGCFKLHGRYSKTVPVSAFL